MLATISDLVKRYQGVALDLGIVACALLMGFALGRLSRLEEAREPVRIIRSTSTPAALISGLSEAPALTSGEGVVASKSGTKYHYPWCGGASRISAANKVSFPSPEAARAKGYSPAANCPGLK